MQRGRSGGASFPFLFSLIDLLGRRNSPGTIVYNQCANEVLRYAVKSHRGLLAGDDSDVPRDVYDKSRLPAPPRPGDIDVIVAGFPWCVSRVVLPRQPHPLTHKGISTADHQPTALAIEHVPEGQRREEQPNTQPPLLGRLSRARILHL